uniref:Uncharacterized protein n=1 Tax=Anguilla anguilla TaxID=7936 RepID=A0A0E9UE32_ANGAN
MTPLWYHNTRSHAYITISDIGMSQLRKPYAIGRV